MKPFAIVPLLSLATAILGGLAGCASHPLTRACEDDGTPAGFDPAAPSAQFQRDVMPVFRQSCAFSSCHGAQNNPNGVYLGSSAADVYTNLVGKPSQELPTMSYVKAGDPAASFLLRKMDGTQCALDAMCTEGSCQDSMPKDESVLDTASRDVVRRWISQGAQND